MTELNCPQNFARWILIECNFRRFILSTMFAVFNLMGVNWSPAQSFAVLHHFTATNANSLGDSTNSDGAGPTGELTLSGGAIYGAARWGGASGSGTLFALNSDGTGYMVLRHFTATHPGPILGTNSDGANPYAGLLLSGGALYGSTTAGSYNSRGFVFSLHTNGVAFTNLPANGGAAEHGSYGKLLLSGSTLFGTLYDGGIYQAGSVFSVNTDGTSNKVLYSFTGSEFDTNVDGLYPCGALTLVGGTLYGTANAGGTGGYGNVFAVTTNGTGFRVLHNFTSPTLATNSDGALPFAGLVSSGDKLYGTTSWGGASGKGTVFAITTNGTGFTVLHHFSGTRTNASGVKTNADGAFPFAALILSGTTLYGTTTAGGPDGNGTVFAINTDGTGFTSLYAFSATHPNSSGILTNSDGAMPYAGLTLAAGTLYGTASGGGSSGNGTVFSLSIPPRLTITHTGTGMILSWPTRFAGFDYTGYTLLSTTNLSPTDWSPAAQPAVTNAGQISVTVPTTVGRKFFRLKSQ